MISAGPKDAPILWVGDVPTYKEMREGRFEDTFFYEARRIFKKVGIDVNKDVRRVYCIPQVVSKQIKDYPLAKLLNDFKFIIDNEILGRRIIVPAGRFAMRAVCGMAGVDDWRGSVIRPYDILSEEYTWYAAKQTCLGRARPVFDPNTLVIPTLDPAAVVNTKGKEGVQLLTSDITKVGKALRGRLKSYPIKTHLHPTQDELAKAIADGARNTLVFDTEFNPESGELYWIGATFDGTNVYGWPFKGFEDLTAWLFKQPLLHVAHNYVADYSILKLNGITLDREFYCTMIGEYVLHPDMKVGLSPASRHHMDDVYHWKFMDKDDPDYNAIDNVNCWWVRAGQDKEASRREIDIKEEIKVRMDMILPCQDMRNTGMFVDLSTREEMIAEQKGVIEDLACGINEAVNPLWVKHLEGLQAKLDVAEAAYVGMRTEFYGVCAQHPKYKPAKRMPSCAKCLAIKESIAGKEWVKRYEGAKKSRDKIKTQVIAKGRGFNFGSSAHLGWYLYSADEGCLNLPIKKSPKGNLKTDGNTIERISKLKVVKEDPGKYQVLFDIKNIQQHTKLCRDFLELKKQDKRTGGVRSLIDSNGYLHPQYKVNGTITGRLACGADYSGEADKIDNSGAYNALNLPDLSRKIYRAEDGWCIVGADWKNQEGRCMAYFSQDQDYLRAFREEDNGGYDVHSITAAIVYGVDPGDAASVLRRFKGAMFDARKCAKIARHGWSYTPTPVSTLMSNYQLTLKEAVEIHDKLSEASPGVVRYKEQYLKEIFGEWEARKIGQYWRAYNTSPGTRFLFNPFGWQYWLLGGGEVRTDPVSGARVALPKQAGEAIAGRAQSTGASIWARCWPQLRGNVDGELRERLVYTGTYDSFYLRCRDDDKSRTEMAERLKDVMEQRWPHMNGFSFPIDVCWGYNLYKWHEVRNPAGLRGMG